MNVGKYTINGCYWIFFKVKPKLVGGFNPSQKNMSQIGSFPQIGMNIQKIFETTS